MQGVLFVVLVYIRWCEVTNWLKIKVQNIEIGLMFVHSVFILCVAIIVNNIQGHECTQNGCKGICLKFGAYKSWYTTRTEGLF